MAEKFKTGDRVRVVRECSYAGLMNDYYDLVKANKGNVFTVLSSHLSSCSASYFYSVAPAPVSLGGTAYSLHESCLELESDFAPIVKNSAPASPKISDAERSLIEQRIATKRKLRGDFS